MQQVDVLIVGAGPAGLMCASTLSRAQISTVILESGGIHPDREAVEGLGGAGLYSDGSSRSILQARRSGSSDHPRCSSTRIARLTPHLDITASLVLSGVTIGLRSRRRRTDFGQKSTIRPCMLTSCRAWRPFPV